MEEIQQQLNRLENRFETSSAKINAFVEQESRLMARLEVLVGGHKEMLRDLYASLDRTSNDLVAVKAKVDGVLRLSWIVVGSIVSAIVATVVTFIK
ncbi:MAG: hypothetical protein MN733_25770 [Nitrososphaera sp.]|nr:hypothetical protein [Nitrososphaera sp.]